MLAHDFKRCVGQCADDGLLQPASRPRRRRRLSVSVDDSSKQVKTGHIKGLSGDFVRGMMWTSLQTLPHNDAVMASPETTETADATMYEKVRTSVLLPKRNV